MEGGLLLHDFAVIALRCSLCARAVPSFLAVAVPPSSDASGKGKTAELMSMSQYSAPSLFSSAFSLCLLLVSLYRCPDAPGAKRSVSVRLAAPWGIHLPVTPGNTPDH